ncbi:transcriptional regulator, AlpA family [Monaibacterium marinum]|uniref:Transcriptional regulator, AlpA family n=1 Tax=Pontivivens marinum TaxID=1690039 RepID=A0A2C9CZ09_9RHOB|nr:AlpA family phage regulatory protein [Monaibacterium marinum]SOH95709.1 transcriptional regulator, AlpA family [Monaibacterium marinum]
MTKPQPDLQLIDRWEVIRMLGISESTLERMLVRDEHFPLPRRLGTRTVRWLKHEVESFIRSLEVVDYFGDGT